ncbi:hypothetical protein [Companilactobacillus furfuricola]|uniref:hypothetical protein n=1 Tax=Companilactobacillus furfuricola TaxID=1462575 RepID=UPI000F795698|nr:hypothetical protein [Companilactobacillus furfuricola]
MKKFDYSTLNNLEITPEMMKKIMEISKLISQHSAYKSAENHTSTRLVEVTKTHPHVEKFTVDTLTLQNLQNKLRSLKKGDLLKLIPEYSQIIIERSLNKLLKKSQIEKIGGRKSTKYILKWE